MGKTLRRQAGGKLRALVLDLRNNPGGLLDQAVAVSADFVAQGAIVSTRGRNTEDAAWLDAKGADIFDGAPRVVLISSGSASASEIVAGALQDRHRAVLVGTRSFGKGSVQTVILFEGNGAVQLTTARHYTPSGRSIQGRGITPDVLVAETREEAPHFDPEHEADLNQVLKGGGAPDTGVASRITGWLVPINQPSHAHSSCHRRAKRSSISLAVPMRHANSFPRYQQPAIDIHSHDTARSHSAGWWRQKLTATSNSWSFSPAAAFLVEPSLGLTSVAPSANEAQLAARPFRAAAIAFATAKHC